VRRRVTGRGGDGERVERWNGRIEEEIKIQLHFTFNPILRSCTPAKGGIELLVLSGSLAYLAGFS